MRYFITSDIHGHYTELKKELDKQGFNEQLDTLIICGDLLDRGKENVKCIQFVNSLPNKVLIKGNHEYNLEKCLREYRFDYADKHNGTVDTILEIARYVSGRKHLKCFPTLCFHNVRELNSKIPFRQHVNITVTEKMFNRILFDNRFFIGDTIQFIAKVLYYESNKINKRYNYRELSIGLKDIGNMTSVQGSKRQNKTLNKEQFQRKGGMTTDMAKRDFRKNLRVGSWDDNN